MMKAIAIDDEPLALEVIRKIAASVPNLEIIGYFTSPLESIRFMRNHPADLVFLDIKMPNFSGFDLLKALDELPMVIFTTAYSEHAAQSFDFDVIDYLLKPFAPARFVRACNKAVQQWQLRSSTRSARLFPSVFIKVGYEQVQLDLGRVACVESIGNYVRFEMADGTSQVSRITFNEAEQLLPAHSFIRVHRSFIVATRRITKMNKRNLCIGDREIPIGAAYSAGVDLLRTR